MLIRPTIIIGLGNPGLKYRNTRHNIGFEIIDALLPSSLRFKKEKKYLYHCQGNVVFIKPLTYMNLSGDAVQSALSKFHRSVSEMLVVSDDFTLPLGKIRVRSCGSSGGHNGIKSIIAIFGTQFLRLKIGVGPLPAGIDPADYVLGKFLESEKQKKCAVISEAIRIINDFLTSGYTGDKTWNVDVMQRR